jgi:hypothetical protein
MSGAGSRPRSRWRPLRRGILLVAVLQTSGCDDASDPRGASGCGSGVGWYEVVLVPTGETRLSLVACLAGECISGEIPVADGTAAAPCRLERIEQSSSASRFVSACAYRVLDASESGDRPGEETLLNVGFEVSTPVADGLADGDEASLLVTTMNGVTVYQTVGPVAYHVGHDSTGNRCMDGVGSWSKTYDSGAGDPP